MDIVSRIVLQASGGDDAAAEVRKVKQAYAEAQKAGEDLSGISLSQKGETDPTIEQLKKVEKEYENLSDAFATVLDTFTKAARSSTDSLLRQVNELKAAAMGLQSVVGKPSQGGSSLGTAFPQEQTRKLGEDIGRTTAETLAKRAKETETFNRAGGAGDTSTTTLSVTRGAGILRNAQTLGSATQQIAASDYIGAGTTALSSAGHAAYSAGGAGSLLAGVGVAAIVSSIILGVSNSLIKREEDRVEALWGSGTSQRMGQSYESTRDYSISLMRQGIPSSLVQSMMSGFSAQGGTFGNQNRFVPFLSRGMEMAASMGIDPSAMAGLLSTTSRFGLNANQVGLEGSMYGVADKSFGRGQVSGFVSELNRATISLAALGVRVKDITGAGVGAQSNLLAGYAQFGGLSSEGAIGLSQSANARGSGAGRLSNAQDLLAFSELKRLYPDKSNTEIQMLMESRPDLVNRAMFESIKRSTGGDSEMMRQRASSWLGGSMSQATAWIDTQTALAAGKTVTGTSDDLLLQGGKGLARELTASNQMNILKGVEESLAVIKAGITKTLSGIDIKALNATNVIVTGKNVEQQLSDAKSAASFQGRLQGGYDRSIYQARMQMLKSQPSFSSLMMYADTMESVQTGESNGEWSGRLARSLQKIPLRTETHASLLNNGISLNPNELLKNLINTVMNPYEHPELNDPSKRSAIEKALGSISLQAGTSFAQGTMADPATMQKFIETLERIALTLDGLKTSGVISDSPRGF